ncbi:MAG: tRNA pseudouridine(38-40) synthase TruA [Agarilytica sp.]
MYTRNCEIKQGVDFPEGMHRYALGVEYQGASFNGFQRQASSAANTVQAHLERAISKIAAEPITLVCSGRTDAGVHACEQVIHFDTLAERPEKAWVQGVNTQLPEEIRVHWGREVPKGFHARFSALARIYRYVILSTKVCPAHLAKNITSTHYTLDLDAMQAAASLLEGEHDFSSFRSSRCQANTPTRRLEYLRFSSRGPLIVLEVKGNAFLHHMVRNLVGTLIDIGRGAKPVEWASELLELRDRTKASPTASPEGLYFTKAVYSEEFVLPERPLGPLFLQS